MTTLEAQLLAVLPPGMQMPAEIVALYRWIESEGLHEDLPTGQRVGRLYPQQALREGWTDDSRPGGTRISFRAEGNLRLHHGFGHSRPEVIDRLCVFAQTGGEGSVAAFWLDPEGRQKIVHLGSGSGSTTVCVLAHEALDFLRLLAIGYDEICWGDELRLPPGGAGGPTRVLPNGRFQQWVQQTFGTTIPTLGTDIVQHPEDLTEAHPQDPFNAWVARNLA